MNTENTSITQKTEAQGAGGALAALSPMSGIHSPAGLQSVTVIGAGNIGSFLIELLARLPAIGRVTIVDHDSYEEKNVACQSITAADVGRPKAVVQAERLREINPRLRVTALVARVEDLPMGMLRADVLLGCLDSRRARRIVNSIAWRLGMPYIDAGVQGDGMLARIQTYRPDETGPCLECLWDEQTYRAEGETYACDGSTVAPAASNAPASLGALAAALQAVELEKILAGDWAHAAAGHEVMIDARSHHQFVTRLPRNPGCRFDHRIFQIRKLPGTQGSLTLAGLFALGMPDLRVEGQQFSSQWACATCQSGREVFGLRNRIAESVCCGECGRGMRAVGFRSFNRLSIPDVPESLLTAPLSTLGFCAGDIITGALDGGEVHFEITGEPGGAS